jgi:hypothetical protein
MKTLNQNNIPVLSLNSGETTRVHSGMFMPNLNQAAAAIVERGEGLLKGPIGTSQVRMMFFGGSALITLSQRRSQQPVGLAVFTWSQLGAAFLWSELERSHLDTMPKTADRTGLVNVHEMVHLPRGGTFIWPSFTRRGKEAVFLAETALWSFIVALDARNDTGLGQRWHAPN